MAETFRPSENFIANAIRGNYTLGLKTSTYHMAALEANATGSVEITALRDRYTPIHDALKGAAVGKGVAVGGRIGDTSNKNAFLTKLVATMLPEWKQTAGNVSGYGPTTQAFKILFGKKDLYSNGKQTERLKNVAILRDKCLAVPALAVLGAAVGSFYIDLEKAMNLQGQAVATVKGDIVDEQTALETMCEMQFSDYGMIVYLFPNSPDKIKSFIDTETIQKHERGALIMGTVNGGKIKTIGKKKFTATSQMKVTLTEAGTIWVIDHAKNPVKPTGVNIPANTPTIVAFPAVGDYTNRVIQIKNLAPTTVATWEVEFL